MRKIIKYHSALLLFFFVFAKELDAQVQLIPKQISFQVPVRFLMQTFSDCYRIHEILQQDSGEQIYNFDEILRTSKIGYAVINDSTIITNGYDSSFSNVSDTQVDYLISFKADTINHKLNDFLFQHHRFLTLNELKQSYEWILWHITFFSVDYKKINDTLISIDLQGAQFLSHLSGYLRAYNFDQFCQINPYPPASSGVDTVQQYVLRDTTIFKFHAEFVLKNSSSNVLYNNGRSPQMTIQHLLSDQALNFSFLSSDHSQSLLIFDILGREVKRIEIPSGVSEYNLPQGQLPSGFYFARLGNMGAKFMVY